jgi:hypothetical protein
MVRGAEARNIIKLMEGNTSEKAVDNNNEGVVR